MSELPHLSIHRLYGASIDSTFAAWITPALLAKWWGPRLFTNPRCEIDATPGGAIHIDMKGPDGTIYPMSGYVKELVPLQRLVFMTEGMHDEKGNVLLAAELSVTFEDYNGMTKLLINETATHVDPVAEEAVNGMEQGLAESLYRLGELLDTLS